MKKQFLTMVLASTVLAATAATNPFFDYKNWKTPHGTYPFNEIHAEHYMPAFEEAMKQGLEDIDKGEPSRHDFQSLGEGQGRGVRLDRGETFFQVLGGEWVDNLDLQAFLLIKTLLQRGVIAGELGLGHPLGSEDERPVVLLGPRGRREGEYQEECQYPVTGKTHPIKKHGLKYTVFS